MPLAVCIGFFEKVIFLPLFGPVLVVCSLSDDSDGLSKNLCIFIPFSVSVKGQYIDCCVVIAID